MATSESPISPEELKSLEQTRHRLYQLTNSLQSLQTQLLTTELLPPPSSLQSRLSVLSTILSGLATQLDNAQPTLSSLVAHPSPAVFLGRDAEKEGILGQLLRKKLEPRVEDWMDKARAIAKAEPGAGDKESAGLDTDQLKELWEWAGPRANAEAREREWEDEFTKEERDAGVENVATGLKRNLNDEDEDESEDEEGDQEMQDASEGGPSREKEPVIPLNEMLRFLSTGSFRPRTSWTG